MRAREFIQEDATAGATSAGSIATIAVPVGSIITRPQMPKTAKYSNSVRSITKRKKYDARG